MVMQITSESRNAMPKYFFVKLTFIISKVHRSDNYPDKKAAQADKKANETEFL